ncbi:MAG: biotin--[acetyl-CoA-carboxylase] ligase [Bacteroidetes bacterium GWC2_33_15]|nr:MAG: biotin--[acetyl-CoA-carboxylase] ligase [Bacteroidetes bacterium GWA2_33_15]OFX51353.1 MAG: biotin--[acetyl-CoA-carboxylase] ligase [Bacteroidetes bacterium GWC2_33_15]OFX63137.1 MAG: biotin--[acetyl-CoA-carboxylase] ligase [Bacteroidetes bacterium GWB2_32_14]OFX70729.1 MAG: biotin--[acetyl-CoA-carboxylase] ligase [Bacteroidetes bacterium GWD2_33_33]HAN18472.1 biotin--[acetyl-CoA-carboxylase] ligase [Bacteroidales bacterium]
MKPFKQDIWLKSTSSTNDYASELLKTENPEEGTILITENQTTGKGLGKNTWESETGKNLTFSIILYPDFLEASQQFLISKVVALGIQKYLSLKTRHVTIKWPNDIYFNDKKIAGILIENSIMGDRIKHSIIGIGININQTEFISNAPNPVSLKQITGDNYLLQDELVELKYHIAKFYSKLRNKQFKEIDREYLLNLYKYKVWHDFKSRDTLFRAKITGVNEFGHLQVLTPDDEIREFDLKEIEFII